MYKVKVNLIVPVNNEYLFLIYIRIVLSHFILLWYTENEPQLYSHHTNKQYDKVLFECFENQRSQHLHEWLRLYILAKITRSWPVFALALLYLYSYEMHRKTIFRCEGSKCVIWLGLTQNWVLTWNMPMDVTFK